MQWIVAASLIFECSLNDYERHRNAVVTCEIKFFWNNFAIISVFYFTCNHVITLIIIRSLYVCPVGFRKRRSRVSALALTCPAVARVELKSLLTVADAAEWWWMTSVLTWQRVAEAAACWPQPDRHAQTSLNRSSVQPVYTYMYMHRSYWVCTKHVDEKGTRA